MYDTEFLVGIKYKLFTCLYIQYKSFGFITKALGKLFTVLNCTIIRLSFIMCLNVLQIHNQSRRKTALKMHSMWLLFSHFVSNNTINVCLITSMWVRSSLLFVMGFVLFCFFLNDWCHSINLNKTVMEVTNYSLLINELKVVDSLQQ